jgi:stage V sporulation protein S
MTTATEMLKVSAQSDPNKVAGAVASIIRSGKGVEIQAIGAGAVNQGVKSIAIARGYLAPNGVDICCVPAFSDVMIENERRTAVKLIIRQVQS